MSEKRQPILVAVVGKRGVGKTFRTMEILRRYTQDRPAEGIKGRRVLILDANDEFFDVPSIDLKNVKWFSFHPTIEIRRIRPYKENGNPMSPEDLQAALSYILSNYKMGLLLVEDINKYTSDSIGKDLLGGIVTLRHVDCDIIMHFQTIGKVGNPKILGNCSVLRMHKTGDTVDRHRDKYEDRYEIVKIAETIIGYRFSGGNIGGKYYAPEERFYLYVNFDKEKIMGDFTRREAERAVREYIWVNESTLIKPMLRIRNERGEFVCKTEEEAMKAKLNELMYLYFKF